MSRRFVMALVVVSAVGMPPWHVGAQVQQFPIGPARPTSMAECDALSSELALHDPQAATPATMAR